MATAPLNQFAQARRRSKARAIAQTVWRNMDRCERTDSRLPGVVAHFDERARRVLADEAGVNPPSEATWSMVVEELRDRVADEKRWLSIVEEAV